MPFKWPFHRAARIKAEAAVETPPLRFGLVLGGGAVRGAAHVGVLSVLEREGIRPDVVAGTSVGALVGAGVAAGVSSADMLQLFTTARWRNLAKPSWGSKLSMLDSNPLGELLERVCEAQTFDDLELPLAAVATDILTGAPYVFTQGSLREALVASAAIPGIFEPVRRDGYLLVDGGVVDNLPVDAGRALGATVIIAVDIVPSLSGTYEPKDLREMLLMSWNIMERASIQQRDQADFVIAPDVGQLSFSDFSQVPVAYEAGQKAAEEALPELRKVLKL